MKLSDALSVAVGRGTPLLPEQERQLLGAGGTLSAQLCRMLDGVDEELRCLLGLRPDLPRRGAHAWTLLTEGESPAWPLMALTNPPPIPAVQAARLMRHLGTAHQAMPLVRARAWASESATSSDQVGFLLGALAGADVPTWGMLLAATMVIQAQGLMLGYWGALSAYIGSHSGVKVLAAQQLLGALLGEPAQVDRPTTLAEVALWAVLSPLHGGWPRPPGEEVVRLANDLKNLPQRTQHLQTPTSGQLGDLLADHLPRLPEHVRHALIHDLQTGLDSGGADPSVGIPVTQQAGHTAYWLHLRQQTHLILCAAGEEGLALQAWSWTKPQTSKSLLSG